MPRPIVERFWSHVMIGGPDACWPWTRSRTSFGYGQFKLLPGWSPQKASRVAWWLTYGDPGTLCVLHRCDNPPCCNPNHLFLGTIADNNRDCAEKGRRAGGRPGNIHQLRSVARRLTDRQLAEALRRSQAGESSRSIARSFGVSHTTISRLVNGQQWRGYEVVETARETPFAQHP